MKSIVSANNEWMLNSVHNICDATMFLRVADIIIDTYWKINQNGM